MATERVNVLLVVLDCARADHLSCYGYGRPTTPFLDQVAHEGVRFQHAITTAPWTLPSHASLFTGLFPSTHGATDEHRFLSSQHTLLPEYLKGAGYRTGVFCANPWVSPETGFGRGVDHFETQRHRSRLLRRAQFYWRQLGDRLLRRVDSGARRSNRALLRWLAASDEPFFAFVHYNEPHLRFDPPPPYDVMFLPPGISRERVRQVNQDSNKLIAGYAGMTDEDFAILAALYDGELRYADARLQEIADALRRSDRWDRTLVIVTADHGENLGEHHMMGHQWVLFDTLLRIPLILRCPSQVPQGFVVEELAQPTDIVPTILKLTGLSNGGGPTQGRPLISDGRATPGPAFTISERFRPNMAAFRQRYPRFDTRPYDVRQIAIRTKREKFVWHSDEANEFYDLLADAGEARNLIEHEAARADALRSQLFDWLAALDRPEFQDSGPALNALMREQLRDMGYIE